MALWVCDGCGSVYAAGLPQCPHCSRMDYHPDYEDGGGEPVAAVVIPPPVSAPKAEHAEFVAAVADIPVEEAAAMTKAELVEQARVLTAEGGDETSPGTSSSTSSSSDGKSSASTPAAPLSPAPTTENPSPPEDPTPPPTESSSAGSTDGATPGTGSGPNPADLKAQLMGEGGA